MSTSGSTNYSTSASLIISGALRIVGAISQGESPTASQSSEALEALNLLVKALEAEGMPLWAIKQTNITLINAVNAYYIGLNYTINIPKPLKVVGAFLHNTSTLIDIPMRIVTRQEYNLLGNKTSQGQPVQVFYEPQGVYGVLHTFPTPDLASQTDRQITIVYQRPFEDFDATTDEPDFPQEWYDALKHLLADRIAPEYGVEITVRNDLTRRAMQLKQEALNFGLEEGSIYFAVERRGY